MRPQGYLKNGECENPLAFSMLAFSCLIFFSEKNLPARLCFKLVEFSWVFGCFARRVFSHSMKRTVSRAVLYVVHHENTIAP